MKIVNRNGEETLEFECDGSLGFCENYYVCHEVKEYYLCCEVEELRFISRELAIRPFSCISSSSMGLELEVKREIEAIKAYALKKLEYLTF